MKPDTKMYDSLSSDYDRFVNWDNRLAAEMPFLENQLQLVSRGAQPTRVLDAACGTGMHAIALAARGFETAGADISAGMIEKATENARSAAVNVRFKQAGFGGLSRSFRDQDCLLCLGNSLPHISGLSMLESTLQDFGACLREGGLLLVQNRNFDQVLTKQDRWMGPESHRSGAGEYLFVRFYDFDPDGLITFHVITLARKAQDGWHQKIEHTRLYPLLKSEVVIALDAVGFKEITLYGGLSPVPFDPETSGNLVVSARWRAVGND